MKSRLRKLMLLALALCMLLTPALALADDSSSESMQREDDVGNVFVTEKEGSGRMVVLDLYGAGRDVLVSGSQVGESALLAGYTVNVLNTNIGGSLRAAAYQVSSSTSNVGVNSTLAAFSIDLGSGFRTRGLYAAAQSVRFAGECETMRVFAQNVTISGTVSGNAYIYADTVQVLDGAFISGELHVYSAVEPTVSDNAAISSINFHNLEQQTDADEPAAPAVQNVLLAAVLEKLSDLLIALPRRLVLAVLLYFLIRKTIADGANMMKARPVIMPVSGLIALISAPIAALLVILTRIGASAGLLVLGLYVIGLCFAVGFSACMTGRLLFPKMHMLLACVISAAIFSVLLVVPVLGGVLRFACALYTLGYFVQRIYLNWQKPASVAADTASPSDAQPPEGAAPVAVENAPEAPAAEPAPEPEAPVEAPVEAAAPADAPTTQSL